MNLYTNPEYEKILGISTISCLYSHLLFIINILNILLKAINYD